MNSSISQGVNLPKSWEIQNGSTRNRGTLVSSAETGLSQKTNESWKNADRMIAGGKDAGFCNVLTFFIIVLCRYFWNHRGQSEEPQIYNR